MFRKEKSSGLVSFNNQSIHLQTHVE